MKKQILDNADVTSSSKQIAILKQHFPACFDKDGKFMPDKLAEIAQAEGADISREGYSLNWLGKSYARLMANLNTETLLTANTEHNAKDENKASENILIQGDNLDVLKHLKNAYAEQIKMIYIDPPYNTGSDGFVYQDDRKFTVEELAGLAGVDEDEAKRILAFTQSSSNSHSAWLTFIYPRLYIAKELLREDGVIFISIDDNEQAQLKLVCDEVFGEENFVNSIAVKMSESTGVKMAHAKTRLPKRKEYVLFYKKGNDILLNPPETPNENWNNEYKEILIGADKEQLATVKDLIYKDTTAESDINLLNGLVKKIEYLSLSKYFAEQKITDEDEQEAFKWANAWRIIQAVGAGSLKESASNAKIETQQLSSVRSSRGKLSLFKTHFNLESKDPRIRILFADKYLTQNPGDFWTDIKTAGGVALEGGIPFPSGKKPLKMLARLIQMSTQPTTNDVVLDFFAGSGTTGHATMLVNQEDEGNRRYISVQIDEPTNPKSEAYQMGFKTVFEVTKGRTLNAIKELADTGVGFKEFKTVPVFEGYLNEADTPDQYTIFEGDKLSDEERAQLLLTWQVYDGLPLTLDMDAVDLDGYSAHQGNHILYCINSGLTLDHILTMLERIDTDKSFAPKKIVVFEYILSSKAKREITEAVKSYNNRKQIELHLEVRL